ncbi:transmembrane protein 79 [Alligator sinensis]|uniref:Transmembrane protein 79 n=1 Tax=Alligator sinensis TaxID=38654 RepID=A0A1U7SV42_ALLSI|nr:transmembrane protein 79 [Alligator sinensis]
MMAIDPVTCMQETTLIELEPLAPSATVEEGVSLGNHQPGDPDTTLPWDQSQCGSGYKETGEPPALAKAESKGQRRPSPEGIQEGTELECPGEAKAFLSPAPLKEQTEDEVNQMPEKAVHMFIPIDTCCIERTPGHCSSAGTSAWKQPVPRHGESTQKETSSSEKQLFVPCSPRHYGKEQPGVPSGCPPCSSCSKANLKAVASMVAAMILYPCFVYGAYVFLPFDAPPMPSMSIRLIYTLRCGTFATFPIILGMIVYGISRLCFSALQPFGELRREVEIHRGYVAQSVHLFILYFFNLAVLATYLPQEALKLIPLLTGLFAISRLLYWVSYAMGRSFRGFGFGLTFLPLLTMLLWNLYSMFVLEPQDLFATADGPEGPLEKKPGATVPKARYWG